MKIESEVGKGTVLNFWFQHDHLDRPPMGDLAGSLVMLFSAHEDIHFIYKHITDDGEFVFDTDEIKEALDGMPMTDVSIMKARHSCHALLIVFFGLDWIGIPINQTAPQD